MICSCGLATPGSVEQEAKPQGCSFVAVHLAAGKSIGEAYLMDNKPAEAEKHLVALQRICGHCEEYEDLAKSIATYKSSH